MMAGRVKMRKTARNSGVSLILSIGLLMAACSKADRPQRKAKPSVDMASEVASSKQAEPNRCVVCPALLRFERRLSEHRLEPSLAAKIKRDLEKMKTQKSQAPLLRVSFRPRDVCENGRGAELLRLMNARLSAYNRLLERLQTCSAKAECSVGINQAEYCALGQRLRAQAKLWRMRGQFPIAALTLDVAEARANGAVMGTLSQTFNGAAMEMQDILNEYFDALIQNTGLAADDPRIETAQADIHEILDSLEVFAWAGMLNGQVEEIRDRLSGVLKELQNLNNDIPLALGRSRLLQSDDRLELIRRTLQLSARIAALGQSLENSAGQETGQAGPKTDANALPRLAYSQAETKAASKCFTRLGLEAEMLAESSPAVFEELQACRPFSDCRQEVFTPPKGLIQTVELLQRSASEDDKMLLAVTNSVCRTAP